MGNMGNKARSILVSAVLALMLCSVSGITVYLHLLRAAYDSRIPRIEATDKSATR